MKSHFQSFRFDKLISVLFETTITFVFRLSDYLHASNNSHLKMFIEVYKHSIQQVIVSRFRFSVVRIDSSERHIKNSSYSLFFYSVEWLLNRAALRDAVQRFDKNIVAFRVTFANLKSRFFNHESSSSSMSKSSVSEIVYDKTLDCLTNWMRNLVLYTDDLSRLSNSLIIYE